MIAVSTGIERMESLDDEEEREFLWMLSKMYGGKDNPYLKRIYQCGRATNTTVSGVVWFALKGLNWEKVQDAIDEYDHNSTQFEAEQILSEPNNDEEN